MPDGRQCVDIVVPACVDVACQMGALIGKDKKVLHSCELFYEISSCINFPYIVLKKNHRMCCGRGSFYLIRLLELNSLMSLP